MDTLAPHSSQPKPLSSRSTSPAPEYITYSNSEPEFHNSSFDHDSAPLTGRGGFRASSPTPSEKEELKEFDGFFVKLFRKENWKDRGFLVSVVVVFILIVITILLTVFHKQIVAALTPAAEWVRKAPAGFLIPIAILVVLSVPPLFGAEIVHVLCGMIYGLWIGFLIVCVGTVLGESLTFFMFRYCLRSRAEKLEKGKGSSQWAALARVIREGGFWVALVIRFSAIPTHIGTALFSVCGMTFFTFLITLVLSLPRQLAGVYIGVLAAESAEGHESKTDKLISNMVLAITIIITVIAMTWINTRMKAAALTIIRERRARENAETEPKTFDSSSGALYDPASAAESGVWTGQRTSGLWTNTANSNVYFGERTPSLVPPTVPAGAMLPAVPGPAQLHVQNA